MVLHTLCLNRKKLVTTAPDLDYSWFSSISCACNEFMRGNRAYIGFDNRNCRKVKRRMIKLQWWMAICDCGSGKAEVMIDLILQRYLHWISQFFTWIKKHRLCIVDKLNFNLCNDPGANFCLQLPESNRNRIDSLSLLLKFNLEFAQFTFMVVLWQAKYKTFSCVHF